MPNALALPFRANCPTRADLFRQIFRDHFDRWCDLRLDEEVPVDQRAYVRETVQRMMVCRDPDAGYARYECPNCGFDLRVPFSCKSRFCPSCGKVRVDEWVNAIAADLLEVPHLHLTLTTDDALRPFFHADRALLNDLLQVAPQAVQAVLADLYPGVRVGMIYTPHTFGCDLGFKPHVHLVMTKGGLKDDAWVEIAEVPGGRLAAKWRYLLCQRLRQRRPEDAALQRVIAQIYVDHHGFQVHTDSFYPKGLDAAQYIGRYLGHPPLATSHRTAYDGQLVTYWYTDTATKAKQTITCSALDFISRLVPHIPPKGIQLVRYAGLYAHSIKRRCAELAHSALEAIQAQLPLFALEPLRKALPNPKWRERITPSGPPSPRWGDGQGQASFGYDPLACPRCGQTMQLAEIVEPSVRGSPNAVTSGYGAGWKRTAPSKPCGKPSPICTNAPWIATSS